MSFEMNIAQIPDQPPRDEYFRIKRRYNKVFIKFIPTATPESSIRVQISISGVTHIILCHPEVDGFVPVVISHVLDPLHGAYMLEVRFNKVSLGSWQNEDADFFNEINLITRKMVFFIKNIYLVDIN